ncbi:hypothetical protein [Ectothiorhodospira lacustris]|uniref:hypothetical protein n=1 Tax=Ectothiorhodospira lacustris TaxID=2899127 RepID=UPI001EE87AFD|nr:hypothetical protein [Ectothiorhodospira lacustris]MCG5500602.1 hypothetical protein [Ectothiorhodospira lacustris]
MLIGILGASGDVGLASVRVLLSQGLDELRLAERDFNQVLGLTSYFWPARPVHPCQPGATAVAAAR